MEPVTAHVMITLSRRAAMAYSSRLVASCSSHQRFDVAAYRQRLAGNTASRLGCQEKRHVGDLLLGNLLPQRNALQHLRFDRLLGSLQCLRLGGYHAPDPVPVDNAGLDRVDADLRRPQLD